MTETRRGVEEEIEVARFGALRPRLVHCGDCGQSVVAGVDVIVICSGQEDATHPPRVCFPKPRSGESA